MRIKKVEPSTGVLGKIVNLFNNSKQDTYSCDYLNNKHQQDITTDGEPVKCGYKIDDKDVYVKRINIPALGNETYVKYETGLTNVTIRDLGGIYGGGIPINFAANDSSFISTYYHMGDESVYINCGMDRTSMNGYVDIYFTYNS